MRTRVWIRSGIREELDSRQQRLLDHVYAQIKHYYDDLHQTEPRFQHPLSLSQLMRLTNRNGAAVLSAIRTLANSVEATSSEEPPIYYDRITSGKNASHRPYRIFLRRRQY